MKPKFLRSFVAKAKLSGDIVTHKYLNGYPVIDLIHVFDLVGLILNVLKTEFNGAVNISGGYVKSTFAIAKCIVKEMGSSSSVGSVSVNCRARNIIVSNRLVGLKFKWKPVRKFEEELSKIY